MLLQENQENTKMNTVIFHNYKTNGSAESICYVLIPACTAVSLFPLKLGLFRGFSYSLKFTFFN